jgi:hypothetical protein
MKTPPARGARWARGHTLICLLSGLTGPVRRPHRTGRQGPPKRSTEWVSAVGRAPAEPRLGVGRRELAPLIQIETPAVASRPTMRLHSEPGEH